jgi:uncharacterized protein YjeT (DUF2065 family)
MEMLAALGLALVVEGAAYALFPQEMKRLMALLMSQPEGFVRSAGLAAALIGLTFVILAKGLP